MMIIKLTFPNEEKPFEVFTSAADFRTTIREAALKEYGKEHAFSYAILDTNSEQIYLQCSVKHCRANFSYTFDQLKKAYILKSFNNEHEHRSNKTNNKKFPKEVIESLQQEGKYIDFVFPKDFTNYRKIKDRKETFQQLKDEWKAQFPQYQFKFRSFDKGKTQGKECFYYFCRHNQCQWSLQYKKNQEDGYFYLKKQNNQHRHYYEDTLHEADRAFPEIFEAFKQADGEMEENDLVTMMQKKLGLNYRQCIHYLKVHHHKEGSRFGGLEIELHMKKFLNYLRASEYLIHCSKPTDTSECPEDIVLISSKKMRFLYKAYGRVVYCEEVQMTQNDQSPQYIFFMFSGLNHNGSHVIFGLGFCKMPTVKRLETLLELFFDCESEENQTFIIEKKSKMMIEAVFNLRQRNEKLKYINVLYFIDSCLGNNEESNFMMATASILKRITNRNINKNYSKFEQILSLYLSLQKETFTGLWVLPHKKITEEVKPSNSKGFAFNDRAFKKTCKETLSKIQSINSTWHRSFFEKSLIEEYILLPEIKKLRLSMSRRPFRELINEINKLPYLNITYYDKQVYLVDDGYYPYTVTTDSESEGMQVWKCECRVKEQKGYPCCHIIKILVAFEKSLFEQIDRFWLVDLAIINLYNNNDIKFHEMKVVKEEALGQWRKK